MGDKRKWPMEEAALENKHVAEASGLMVASRVVAREEEGRQRRRRKAVDSSEHRASEEDVAVDADMATTIRQFPSHL